MRFLFLVLCSHTSVDTYRVDFWRMYVYQCQQVDLLPQSSVQRGWRFPEPARHGRRAEARGDAEEQLHVGVFEHPRLILHLDAGIEPGTDFGHVVPTSG
jgi:hypothetical protein